MSRRAKNKTRKRDNVVSLFEDYDERYFDPRGHNAQRNTRSAGMNTSKFRKNIAAKTEGQTEYLEKLDLHDILFAIGPAGSGKTFIAVNHAVDKFQDGEYEKIIISRPAVEAGEKLGFLPGDMKEKVDPYMQPIYDVLEKRFNARMLKQMIENRQIEIAPIAFLRGRNLENAIIIVDEAQNCTRTQLKMVMTRLATGSKMIITGDSEQVDIPVDQSGLADVVDRIQNSKNARRIGAVELTASDVVRHPAVIEALALFED